MAEEFQENKSFERIELVVNTMNSIVNKLDNLENQLSDVARDLDRALDVLEQ